MRRELGVHGGRGTIWARTWSALQRPGPDSAIFAVAAPHHAREVGEMEASGSCGWCWAPRDSERAMAPK
jgi:hypothetical protein